MKLITILFVIMILLMSFACTKEKGENTGQEKPEVYAFDRKIKDCTLYDSCQAVVKFDTANQPRATTVLIKRGTKLRFVKDALVDTAIFIIPKADILFENLYPNKYEVVIIGNTTYLYITLTDKNKSKQFKITFGANTTGEPKPYPYSVYLPTLDKMAESFSSPEIIVEPGDDRTDTTDTD